MEDSVLFCFGPLNCTMYYYLIMILMKKKIKKKDESFEKSKCFVLRVSI